ncbi:MAG TPA: DoxX family protein [bacterium]|jgi:putative oxidoreductase
MKDRFTDFGLLLLRVLVGLALMYHGWLKVVHGVPGFAEGITKMGQPFDSAPLLFAWLSTVTELLGGFFLLLGLWTRYAAIALIINLSVAAFVRNAGNPIIDPSTTATMELALTYLTMVAAIFIMGPGHVSVDGSRGGKRSAPKKPKK